MSVQDFKLTIIGDSCCGKSALVSKHCLHRFDPNIPNTVGVSNQLAEYNIDGKTIQLKIWDTAGQEKFTKLIPLFLRGTQICIIVADITNEDSISHIEKWHEALLENGSNPPVIVAINKLDLCQNSEEKMIQIMETMSKQYSDIVFTSAKTGSNVDALFELAAKRVKEANKLESNPNEGGNDEICVSEKQEKSNNSCC